MTYSDRIERQREREAMLLKAPPSVAHLTRQQWAKEDAEEAAREQLEQSRQEASERLSDEVRDFLARMDDDQKLALELVLGAERELIMARRAAEAQPRIAEAQRKEAIRYEWGKVRALAKRLGVDGGKAREVFVEVTKQTPPSGRYWGNTEPQEWESRFRSRGLV